MAKSKRSEYSYCGVCRRNHDQGRGHKYCTSHCQALGLVLSKMLSKMKHIREALNCPMRVEGSLEKFWCYFCEEDIVQHDSLLACSSGIHHFAGAKHQKNVDNFLFEHGGDSKAKHLYYLSSEDYSKWERACRAATTKLVNNIHNNQCSMPSLSVEPLLAVLKDEIFQDSRQNSAGNDTTPSSEMNAKQQPTLQARNQQRDGIFESLRSVSEEELREGEGNVHSGAAPPWFMEDSNCASTSRMKVSKTKQRKVEKSKSRVGAAWAEKRKTEIERERERERESEKREKRGDWLPSFGRVWQSGGRRETKKEFEAENALAAKYQVEPLQPYVGKRKRQDKS